MSVNAVTHLNFRGDARAALTFYQSVFGGELTIVTYKDAGNVQDPSEAEQVTWGQVAAGDGFSLMAYDVPSAMPWNPGENAFFVSLRGRAGDTGRITGYWESLYDGATVLQPLGPAQWSPLYGMLKDQFGIIWVLDIVSDYEPS